MSETTRKRKATVTGICRTCLNELESDAETYSVNAMIPGFKPIAEIIMDFTTVPVILTDSLPKNICSECYDNFLHMSEFRELIRVSHLNLMLVSKDKSINTSNTNQHANKIYTETTTNVRQPVNKAPKIIIKEEKIYYNEGPKSYIDGAEEFTLTVEDIGLADEEEECQYEDENNQNIMNDFDENGVDEETHIVIKEEDGNDIEYYEELEETEYTQETEDIEENEEETEVESQIVEEFDDEEGETLELRIDESGDEDVSSVCVDFVKDQHIKGSGLTTINKISDIQETYKCNQCTKIFNSPYLLINHKKVCAANRNIPDRNQSKDSYSDSYVCDLCEKSFQSKLGYQKHILKAHQTGNKRFACGCCDATFEQEKTLVQHLRYHVAGVEYKCLFCSEAFPNNNLLKDHVRCNHCNFTCAVCHKGFTTAENLKLHKKFSHQPIMMEEKTCPFCEKTIRACFFDMHVLKHTK